MSSDDCVRSGELEAGRLVAAEPDVDGVTDASSQAERVWWGEVSIAQGSSAVWRIGPLRLRIRHRAGEWQVVYRPGDGPAEVGERGALVRPARRPAGASRVRRALGTFF